MSAVVPLPTSEGQAAERLHDWLLAHRHVFVLTGAGISTAAGIPDYRGPDGQWKRQAPITYRSFVDDPAMRARYWARSFAGWPAVELARPTPAHDALVRLEALGRVAQVVTQNVDGLHERAGQGRVVDLHGRIDQVVCLQCATRVARAEIQSALAAMHPRLATYRAAAAPDGDADLEHVDTDGLRVPACTKCNGTLKPDVVFFGENVPRQRVADAQAALREADGVLVVGSSLMVYSGYRFARMAGDLGISLAILNRGVTRGDALATLKLDADCQSVLPGAVQTLFN